jgi:hypothetical protein
VRIQSVVGVNHVAGVSTAHLYRIQSPGIFRVILSPGLGHPNSRFRSSQLCFACQCSLEFLRYDVITEAIANV